MKRRSVNRILLFIARLADSELAPAVDLLKVQNEILHARLSHRVHTTPAERARLLKAGKPLGRKVRGLLSIVNFRTFQRWKSQDQKGTKRRAGPGRPRKSEQIRQLVIRMARENEWGYPRIVGELRGMGMKVSAGTVRNILKEAGIEPAPKRGTGSWDEFVKIHKASLWATDFFTKDVMTAVGKLTCYVLFFMHVGNRQVHVAGITPNPDGPWMATVARQMRMVFQDVGTPSYILRDGDKKFTAQFKAITESEGAVLKKLPYCSPNLNAYAEAWVGSLKRECLDRLVVVSPEHLGRIIGTYVSYYQSVRPHRANGNRPLGIGKMHKPEKVEVKDGIACDCWLGGLLRRYRRVG